jgi:hypothetical protein
VMGAAALFHFLCFPFSKHRCGPALFILKFLTAMAVTMGPAPPTPTRRKIDAA